MNENLHLKDVIVSQISSGRYLCTGVTVGRFTIKHRHETLFGAWYCTHRWVRIPFFFLLGYFLPKIVILLFPTLTK